LNSDITLILLSHKSRKLVLDYIQNIYGNFKIIIIDNSNDIHLKNFIENNYPLIDIYLINNNGYGNAANYGSRLVNTEYFLISNPDVKGINDKSLIEFVKVARKLNNKFSTLGPRYLNVKPKTHKQTFNNNYIAEIKFISGACMFFKKKNFEYLNGFDENFFLYFEENDYCKRGYKINKNYQLNHIKVEHNAGTSVEIYNEEDEVNQKKLRTWHFIWSKFYYYRKHYGFMLAIIFFIPIIIRINFKLILYYLIKDKKNLIKYKIRKSGLYNSILGKKSFYRI
jgi:GT2 family glycosyltransferase